MRNFLFIVFVLCCHVGFTQNLTPNPDFSNFTVCPSGISIVTTTDWIVPTGGSSDYFHVCATNPNIGVPDNLFGSQASISGAYVGMATYLNDLPNYREYVQATFAQPLNPGCYEITLKYSLAELSFASDGLGVLLTNGPPMSYVGSTSQLTVTDQFPNAYDDWIIEQSQFVSLGGETHITIGNFLPDSESNFSGPAGYNYAYYYIDSVSVEFLTETSTDIMVELGDDMYICESEFPITLESNNPNFINIWNTGESTPSIEISAPGKYILRSIDNCMLGIDSVEIFVIPDPVFELDNTTFCEGDSVVISLDGSLGTYAWQDGSSSTTYTINESGTYPVILTHQCGEIEQIVEVEVVPSISIPTIDDVTICETDLPLVVNLAELDNPFNTFDWSSGSTESLIFIIESGNYNVLVYNDCFFEEKEFSVTVQSTLPDEIIFSDTLLCDGEVIIIDPGVSGIPLLWQDGSTDSVYVVSEAGLYRLEVTNACGTEFYEFNMVNPQEIPFEIGEDLSLCPGDSVLLFAPDEREVTWNNADVSDSLWVKEQGLVIAETMGVCTIQKDTIVVTFDGANPVLELGDSLLLCEGDTILLSAGSSTSGIDFEWSTGSQEATIPIFAGGLYSVSANNNCGSAMDSINVYVGEAIPTINLNSSYNICPSDSISLSVLPMNNEVLWSTGSQDSSIILAEMGDFSVSISNSCGTNEFGFEIVVLDTLSPVELGDGGSICQGDSLILEGPIVDGEYNWSTGSTDENITITNPGLYSLVINGVCNSISDSVEIGDMGFSPTVDLGNDRLFCEGDSLELVAQGTAIEAYTWSTGETEESIFVTDTGAVIVLVSNACGAAFDTININYNDEIPMINLGMDQVICAGDSVLLDVGNVAGTISWNTGSESSTIYVSESGLYIAELISSCGNSIDSVMVSFESMAEEIELSEDAIICEGDSIELSISNYSEGIEWSSGEETEVITAKEAGIYYVTVTTICESLLDSVTLETQAGPMQVDLGIDTTICPGDFVLVELEVDVEDQVIWNDTNTSPIRSLDETGLYVVAVFNDCGIVTDSLTIDFIPSVEPFEFEDVGPICIGDTVFLDGYQENGLSYEWQDGSEESFYDVTDSGIYMLSVTNPCGSESATFNMVYLEEVPILAELDEIYEVCAGTLVDILLNMDDKTGVEWSDGDISFSRQLGDAGIYSYRAFSECSDTSFTIEVVHKLCIDEEVYIPNVFSPNNDGLNDVFRIFYPEAWLSPKIEVQIFSRWGEQVFLSEDPSFEWDGRFKGKALNPGVYAYVVEVEVFLGEEIRQFYLQGDVTIMR